jgi:hypothetical protein
MSTRGRNVKATGSIILPVACDSFQALAGALRSVKPWLKDCRWEYEKGQFFGLRELNRATLQMWETF